jgi:hypothetical protein
MKSIILLITAISVIFSSQSSVNALETYPNSTSEKHARSQTVYITRTGQRYHLLSCRHLQSCIPIEKQEARNSGYTPCKVCNPG